MKLVDFVLLFAAGCCGAAANILMKQGISRAGGFALSPLGLLRLIQQPAFVCGTVLTGVAGLIWFRILATQKLSTCYPLFVSLSYLLISLGAVWFLHEKISAQKVAGLVIIVAGIAVVARG